jgi:putative phosphoribosyl transferase
MFQDRLHAGQLLSERLKAHLNSKEAVVVAIPYGGIPVGYQLAKELNLPLEIVPCRKIRHPGCRDKSIGSVGLEETIVHEDLLDDIPHDFIAHQIRSLRSGLKHQKKILTGDRETDLAHKIVILVDDRLKTGDTMLAGLRTVQKQNPRQVIVAVPVATTDGAHLIEQEADELVCLEILPDPASIANAYNELMPVDENEAFAMIKKSI